MIEIPSWMEGTELVIELQGADESVANQLKEIFNNEDDEVIFSHAFGGADAVIIITLLGRSLFEKLMDYWGKVDTMTPKTTFKIDKTSIIMNGYKREDVEALLASPNFQKAVRAARSK